MLERCTLSGFRKWGIFSLFLKNRSYRFSNKIPGLLGSYWNVFTVLYSLERAGHIFDRSVCFAKISAMRIGKLLGKNVFTVYFSFSSEGQTNFPIYSYYGGWGLILRTFETIPLKCAVFQESYLVVSQSYFCPLVLSLILKRKDKVSPCI